MNKIFESAEDLSLYTAIITMYSAFVDAHSTGTMSTYKKMLSVGIGIIPKDKIAIKILGSIINAPVSLDNVQGRGGMTDAIQPLENKTFAELPVTVRPVFKKEDGSVETACWCKKVGEKKEDVKVFTKVWDLLNMNGESDGYWCDANGEKVELI